MLQELFLMLSFRFENIFKFAALLINHFGTCPRFSSPTSLFIYMKFWFSCWILAVYSSWSIFFFYLKLWNLVCIDADDVLFAGFSIFTCSSLVLLTFTQIGADSKVTIFHVFFLDLHVYTALLADCLSILLANFLFLVGSQVIFRYWDSFFCPSSCVTPVVEVSGALGVCLSLYWFIPLVLHSWRQCISPFHSLPCHLSEFLCLKPMEI